MVLPRWASSVVVLATVYVFAMIFAALWLPHEWDWAVWDWLSTRSEPRFDSAEISVVDVPWTTSDLSIDRLRVATFLNELVARKIAPRAVILDIEFGPCQTAQCEGSMSTATQMLTRAIRLATESRLKVYAIEQPILDALDVATGIKPRNQDLYGVLTGFGHTRFTMLSTITDATGLFYRACYNAPLLDDEDRQIGVERIWNMVDRVQMSEDRLAGAPCDTDHVPLRVPDGARSSVDAVMTRLSAAGSFNLPENTFDEKYIIVGTIQTDAQDPQLPGPELLAWALSDSLIPGTRANAEGSFDTEPADVRLTILVPGFSAIAVTVYIATFFLLKGTRLGMLRPALPWLAIAPALALTLAVVVAFEWLLLSAGHIQPQVTLIVVGILLATFLASIRAFQYLFDMTWIVDKTVDQEFYDWDVFVSYAHDERDWVIKNLYEPLCNARLADGRKLRIFFDTTSIRYGTAWQEKITLSIDGARIIVPVYSETYFSRPYCIFEIMRAHLKWINAGANSRCVLPIMLGKPNIPQTVSDIEAQSVDDVPELVSLVIDEIVKRLSYVGRSSSAPPSPQRTAS